MYSYYIYVLVLYTEVMAYAKHTSAKSWTIRRMHPGKPKKLAFKNPMKECVNFFGGSTD